MKQIICWILGHKPMRLSKKSPIFTIKDGLGAPLFHMECCWRCQLVYWHSQDVAQ